MAKAFLWWKYSSAAAASGQLLRRVRLAFPQLPLALSQLDLVAVDSRRLGPARLAAAAIVFALVVATLDFRRALLWGGATLACEGWMWAVTGPFARRQPVGRGRFLAGLLNLLRGALDGRVQRALEGREKRGNVIPQLNARQGIAGRDLRIPPDRELPGFQHGFAPAPEMMGQCS